MKCERLTQMRLLKNDLAGIENPTPISGIDFEIRPHTKTPLLNSIMGLLHNVYVERAFLYDVVKQKASIATWPRKAS